MLIIPKNIGDEIENLLDRIDSGEITWEQIEEMHKEGTILADC